MKITGAYRTTASSSPTTILTVTSIHLECERAETHYKLSKGEEVIFRTSEYQQGKEK